MSLSIFNVQRCSLQDGPGIRTTVFLKGCALRCGWCHNPESQEIRSQIMYYPEKCISCGRCEIICPSGVHSFQNGRHLVEKNKCIGCGKCVRACLPKALSLAGEKISIDELFERIKRDQPFYQTTNGGVTFSGGEPILQAVELEKILIKCQSAHIHTAIETALYAPWSSISGLIPYTDLWLCDVKAITPAVFRNGCGSDNRGILENLRKLADCHVSMIARVPLIPGFNNTEAELKLIADFIGELGSSVLRTEILPYHDIGKTKYSALQSEYPWKQENLSNENINRAADVLHARVS